MKLVLSALLWICANSITQSDVDALARWGLCPIGTVATADCTWNTRCFSVDCLNGEAVGFQFDKHEYQAVNATERLLWANFVEMQDITVLGGIGPSTVELYPELALMPKLARLTFLAAVTGTIPNELAGLTRLQRVEIRSLLSGTIPAGFAQMPMQFFSFSTVSGGSNLEGPIPNFANSSVTCQLSQGNSAAPNNINLFCACNGSCATNGGYNRCSVACGRISTTGCNEAVATLGNGYVCLDACSRCGTQCYLSGTAYRCPGDPTSAPPPPATESSRTTPTIDGDDNEPSWNAADRSKLF